MARLTEWMTETYDHTRSAPLVRAAVAYVFLVSGILKFAFANQGAERFAKIGFPAPAALAAFVGIVEISAALLVAAGLFTRGAAAALSIDMLVAIVTTKLPLLVGAGAEMPGAPPKAGFWAFAYQARLDLAMLVCCAFLVVSGAGAWSLGAWLARRKGSPGIVPVRVTS